MEAADPDVVQQFIKQDRPPTETDDPSSGDLRLAPPKRMLPPSTTSTGVSRATGRGVNPVGLIPVTVRLRPEIAGALKRASLERQLDGEEPSTQQQIVELALEPWLRQFGFLTGTG